MAQENAEIPNSPSKAVSFSSLKPQLFIHSPKAAEAVQFYKDAFGAEELSRTTHPKRKAEQGLPLIICAQLKLGPSVLVVCYEADETVKKTDVTGFSFCLETDDVEAAVANAVKAGAVVVEDMTEGAGACCGSLGGTVKDPFGYVWAICAAGNKCADVAA